MVCRKGKARLAAAMQTSRPASMALAVRCRSASMKGERINNLSLLVSNERKYLLVVLANDQPRWRALICKMRGTRWFEISHARSISNGPGSSLHVSTGYRFSWDTFSDLGENALCYTLVLVHYTLSMLERNKMSYVSVVDQ
jgi:hypothetical protein